MASGKTFGRTSCLFSKQIISFLRHSSSKSANSFNNIGLSKTLRSLAGSDQHMLQTVKKLNKIQVRQLQNSMATMCLSSKVNLCMNLLASTDSDLVEVGEDSDDVCSQSGHKKKARGLKIL
ncbi:uncharacterized protein LOC136082275 [Hydra vulgaris]|uniref:Uncharacterized protein LOC136082275 n=1 Tax=Hydra vulgaris TaxID=6087 RepID=A0ABM4C611_HYDVU